MTFLEPLVQSKCVPRKRFETNYSSPITETGPLFVGLNFALRYNALKMTKNFGVLIDSIITRSTVMGDE